MLPDDRAVVFDLDDTLYPYRRFVLSGFRAVADRLHRAVGADPQATFARLARAGRGRHRGRELQLCLRELQLPEIWIEDLLDTVREHEPQVSLPKPTRHLLVRLRADGWRLGLLTDGPPMRQGRKVRALGLDVSMDRVVYAASHGTGTGKPEAPAFLEVADQLAVPVAHTVFVGNSEIRDVVGAGRVGMVALRCDAWTGPQGPTSGRGVACQMLELEEMTRSRLKEALSRHVA